MRLKITQPSLAGGGAELGNIKKKSEISDGEGLIGNFPQIFSYLYLYFDASPKIFSSSNWHKQSVLQSVAIQAVN